MRRSFAALLVVAGCGLRTPATLDVRALVAEHGAVAARRELTIRVLEHPRDIQARLALAALAEQTGRPSEAIEQLEAVLRLGGPFGTRWHAGDRARLGRLLLARGRVRLARGAATALDDLERARSYGAKPTDAELERARVALAITELRHVAARQRAKGRATLAALAERDAQRAVRNAAPAVQVTPDAPAESRATVEPHRARMPISADEAATWRGARDDASPAERGAYGAWAWRAGARREAYDSLAAWHAATQPPRDPQLQAAYLRALAWWSPVWLGEVPPPPAEELVGPERCWFPGADCTPAATEPAPPEPAATTALAGLPSDAPPRTIAAARYAATRLPHAHDLAKLLRIASAFARDPARAERLGRDFVAESPDAALGHATLGALFDALGDPARARAAWQAAVTASPEPAFVRGLAEAAAHAGDGPAALVFATQAAAAWGDPAVVWTGVAHALADAGQYVDALTAARNALDLAGPEVLPDALDVAIAASRALGRQAQVDALAAQRARLDPLVRGSTGAQGGAADARTALAAHRERPTAATIARLWVVSRARPRDVELRAALVAALDREDPRRATIVRELIALAGDPDPQRALAAVTALPR